mmetsp:Transcript_14473/g.36215  ORF Transcript_14473/g.36215 Transcript_14473/m.36215 type:complete len:584 (-) Transcript_14473:85-1836(-)|eukprot:CAMPEP_0179000832 /NCGR_PEP_ID=MMETSP0795-20121207/10941_1 /TAXON_ID=88552 /ORGANISM="Amoebophrya sp., Strain Ameob2" /LENGTH=583 /DNA_ID=CAMNT_0020693973 /DNA_START=27 /DNA_END=1781 /DNA_ORIENTATION=-
MSFRSNRSNDNRSADVSPSSSIRSAASSRGGERTPSSRGGGERTCTTAGHTTAGGGTGTGTSTSSSGAGFSSNNIPGKVTNYLKQLSKSNSKIERLSNKVEKLTSVTELQDEVDAAKVLIAEASAVLGAFQCAENATFGERELFKAQHRKLSESLAQLCAEHEKLAGIGLERVARVKKEQEQAAAASSSSKSAESLPSNTSTCADPPSGDTFLDRSTASGKQLYPQLGSDLRVVSGARTGAPLSNASQKSTSPQLQQRPASMSPQLGRGDAALGPCARSSPHDELLQELQQASSEANQQIQRENAEIDQQMNPDEVFRNELIAERNTEISGIHRDMATIQSLYKELGQHVEEQGESIVQMEQTVSATVDHTEWARREIEASERSMKKQTRIYSCLMVLTLVCVCFIVLFFYDLIGGGGHAHKWMIESLGRVGIVRDRPDREEQSATSMSTSAEERMTHGEVGPQMTGTGGAAGPEVSRGFLESLRIQQLSVMDIIDLGNCTVESVVNFFSAVYVEIQHRALSPLFQHFFGGAAQALGQGNVETINDVTGRSASSTSDEHDEHEHNMQYSDSVEGAEENAVLWQ